jgi:trimethylamine--corrinoid protein Co-methyltransferase
LKWSGTTSDNAMKCAELGVPVEFVPMPTAGLVAPVSVLGCVIQHAAEAISGVVLSQTVNPGAPVLYGVSPGVFDMRSMGATVCAVESQMIACACNEVGKYLGLPTQAYIGSSDSKLLDAQSGFESGTGLYLAALSGVNSVSGPGMTDFQTAISLEKLFVDSEMCRIAKRLAAGIEIREDLPAGPLMEELLREGNLLTSDHTLRYFRQEHYMPGPAIDRGQMKAVNAINPDTAERAHVEVLRRLSEYKPPAVLDRGQQAELDRIMRSAAGAFDFDPVSRRFAV